MEVFLYVVIVSAITSFLVTVMLWQGAAVFYQQVFE